MREEAGAAEVFAGAVRFDAVGLPDVVGCAAEVVGVGQAVLGDGDDPFEAVAGGAPEEQFRLEVFVLQEFLEEAFDIGQMVKIQADELGDFKDVFVAAGAELAAEGGVVEVGGFVEACLVLVGEGANGPGLLGGVVTGDVGEGSGEGDALVGAGVGDGGTEEGESGSLGLFAGLLVVLEVFFQVQVHLLVDVLQQELAGFAVVAFGKVEGVAVGNGAGEVVVDDKFVTELLFGLQADDVDFQAELPVVEGVADDSAVPSFDVHHDFGREVLPDDVGVDVGSVEGLAEDGGSIDHGCRPFGVHRPGSWSRVLCRGGGRPRRSRRRIRGGILS